MRLEVIDLAFETIQEAKREMHYVDLAPSMRPRFDEAYRALSDAAKAIADLATPISAG